MANKDHQRLLDRALIPETLVKMYWAFDTRRPEVLQAEVFASRIQLDFTALFGGDPQDPSNQELVDFWMKMRDYTTTAQQSLAGILPLFPAEREAPDRVPVFSNVLVYLRKEAEGKATKEATCDATLDLELVKEDDKGSENPWRVAQIKANVIRQENYQEFWVELFPGA